MPRTIVDPRFRGRLAGLLLASPLSQAQLARQANISRSYLSELINATKNPSPGVARALDDALSAGGQLAACATIPGSPEDLDHLAAATLNPRQVGAATLDAYARVLAAQRHLDDTMGSAAVLQPTLAQMHTITAMTVEAVGAHRRPVLYQAAQWAEFLGWLHTSTGRWEDARSWFSRALEWAIEIGDADMTATALSYQAHLAWLSAQWGPTIGLAAAALRDPGVYPGQRAYDMFQSARAYAAIGEVGDADRLLGSADTIAAKADGWDRPVPAWQYYRAGWYWSLERGLVLLYMARHKPDRAAAAVAAFEAGMAGMPGEMRGADWAAEYLVYLASAHKLSGDRDAAAAVLGQARGIAERTRSSRVLHLVRGRERALGFAA